MVAVGGAVLRLHWSSGGSVGVLAVPARGDEWQTAYHLGMLHSCVTPQGVRATEVSQNSHVLG